MFRGFCFEVWHNASSVLLNPHGIDARQRCTPPWPVPARLTRFFIYSNLNEMLFSLQKTLFYFTLCSPVCQKEHHSYLPLGSPIFRLTTFSELTTPVTSALAIGPGIATEESTAKLVFKLLAEAELPTVIDADGLNILADDPERVKDARVRPILTPHPGEASRLLGTSSRRMQEDRISAARHIAAKTNAVVLLKGARSVIVDPDGRLAINPTGNPGMATGGTGDVLTGIIGGLLAQGLDPFEAASAGAWIHGRAGDLGCSRTGCVSLKAGDLIESLPDVFRELTGS